MPRIEEPNEKMREQIEEILEQEEKRAPAQPPRRELIPVARPASPRKVRSSGIPLWYPTPEKLIVFGLILLVIAAVTRTAVLPLTLGGFVLAGIGYYLLIVKRRRAKYGNSTGGRSAVDPQPYWRGRPVNKPGTPVKKRDGNVLEFPDTFQTKKRSWFGKKK